MDIKYVAGLFDGEGSFSIENSFRENTKGKERYRANPAVTIRLKQLPKNLETLENLRDKMGGKIYTSTDYKTQSSYYSWTITSVGRCKEVAEKLIPHLSIKDDIGREFIKALDMWPSRKGVRMSMGEHVWSKQLCIEVASIATSLNPDRKGKTPLSEIISRIEELYADGY